MEMNNVDLVSVIIPTYNCEKYVRQAIMSVLEQTYKHVEIIVVDDGSTDNTKTVLNDLIADEKINYIYQPNKGLAGARNTGIYHSKGDYLVFLDADDFILSEKIIDQLNFMKEHPHVCLVYSDYRYFYNSNMDNLISHSNTHRRGNVYKEIIKGNFFIVHSAMVRKKCIEQVGYFDESLQAHEDWDLWVRMAAAGCQFDYLDKILCLCRIRPDSMQFDRERMLKTYKQVLNKILLSQSSQLEPADRFIVEYLDNYRSWELIYHQLKNFSEHKIHDELYSAIVAIRKLYNLTSYNTRNKSLFQKESESIGTKSNELIETIMLIIDLHQHVYNHTLSISKKDAVIQEKDAIIREKDDMIKRLLQSKSWKMTASLRKIEDFIKGLLDRGFLRYKN